MELEQLVVSFSATLLPLSSRIGKVALRVTHSSLCPIIVTRTKMTIRVKVPCTLSLTHTDNDGSCPFNCSCLRVFVCCFLSEKNEITILKTAASMLVGTGFRVWNNSNWSAASFGGQPFAVRPKGTQKLKRKQKPLENVV